MRETKFKETKIGKIPEDWEIMKIKKVSKINELTIKKSYPYKEIEYIDISSVDKGRITGIQKFTIDEAPSRAKRIVRDEDIIISTVRPNLKHFAFIKKAKTNLIASTGFAVISSKNVVPNFLYYYLTTNKYTNFLAAIADTHTSAYPACNPDVIEESYFPYPKEKEQKSISKILSDLDSKIELNQKMNKILDAIGKAIFKRWFIDFEFPNDEGKPYKSSGGQMVYNEELDKEIPKGWEIGRLSRIVDITMGTSPPGDTYNEIGEGLPFFQGRRDFGFRYPYSRVFCTAPKRIAEEDDVLFTVRAPVGDLNLALCKCAIGRGVASIRGKNNTNSFVYYLLNATINEWKRFDSEGTVFGAVNKDDVNNFKIIIPEKDKIIKFNIFAKNIDMKIKANTIESQYLSDLRDSLLPRLMSGRIRTFIGGSSKHGS